MPNQQGCSNGGGGGKGDKVLHCNKTALENENHSEFHIKMNPSFEYVSMVTTVIQIVDL